MILIKDTIFVPKLIFPLVSNEDHLRKILNVNQWDKFDEFLSFKLILATEIFFNRYIYYHLKDTDPYKKEIFYNACKHANMEIIQLMIDKGANYWNSGLINSCEEGHLIVVQLMIEKIESELATLPHVLRDKKGADYWNDGLLYACIGGNLLIVQLMVDKGANFWNSGLKIANDLKHLEIANYLSKLLKIEKFNNTHFNI